MKRPVFSFRPNLKNPNHRKAWEILMGVPEGGRTSYLADAVLFLNQKDSLEAVVRRAVREELKGRFLPSTPEPEDKPEKEDVPEEMFEFLAQLQEE